MEKPLMLVGCGLHANESIFRAVFTHTDGPTTGPKTLRGPIGQRLSEEIHLKPLVSSSAAEYDTDLAFLYNIF